jgi:hypothetical protein
MEGGGLTVLLMVKPHLGVNKLDATARFWPGALGIEHLLEAGTEAAFAPVHGEKSGRYLARGARIDS